MKKTSMLELLANACGRKGDIYIISGEVFVKTEKKLTGLQQMTLIHFSRFLDTFTRKVKKLRGLLQLKIICTSLFLTNSEQISA